MNFGKEADLLVYCDYLADILKRALIADEFIVNKVQGVFSDTIEDIWLAALVMILRIFVHPCSVHVEQACQS